jgi:hypothetical protein
MWGCSVNNLYCPPKNTAFPKFPLKLCRDKNCYTKYESVCSSKLTYQRQPHLALSHQDTTREKCLKFILFGDLKFDLYELGLERMQRQEEKQIYIGSWIFLFFRQELDRITNEDALLGIMWDFLFSDFCLYKAYDALCANTLLRNKQWNEITPTTLLSAFNSTQPDYFENSQYVKYIQGTLTGCVRTVKIACAKLGNKDVSQTPEERAILIAEVQSAICEWERIARMLYMASMVSMVSLPSLASPASLAPSASLASPVSPDIYHIY